MGEKEERERDNEGEDGTDNMRDIASMCGLVRERLTAMGILREITQAESRNRKRITRNDIRVWCV